MGVEMAKVEGLDYRGRGVVREEGRVAFIAGALPGEEVRYQLTHTKKRFAEGVVSERGTPAAERVSPACPYYAQCGGCDVQHLALAAQRRWKETWWQEQLRRLGGGEAEECWPTLSGAAWHYRRRARLAVQDGKVGFRARHAHAVVDIERCLVLEERLNALLPALRAVQGAREITLDAGDQALAIGLHGQVHDKQALALAEQTGAGVWVNGKAVVASALSYALPEFAVEIAYTPAHFTQANAVLNRAMVAQAMRVLAPQAGERIGDFFAGLGNFSLPLARLGAQVVAFEGEADMVRTAQDLADGQGLAVSAQRADLFAMTAKDVQRLRSLDAWLLDPPRAGAQALVSAIGKGTAPARIVYVSCDPATLARDAAILRSKGYRLSGGGVVDLFAQSADVESMALFVREK